MDNNALEETKDSSIKKEGNSARCLDNDKSGKPFRGWKRFVRYDENGKMIHEDVPLPPELQEEWEKGMQEWFEDEYSSPEDQNYWRQRLAEKQKSKN